MYYRIPEARRALKFGSFTVTGPDIILDELVEHRIAEFEFLPPVPEQYKNFVLKKYVIIDITNELLLIFE